MTSVTVVTRSAHKLREIRELLGAADGLKLIDLTEAGIPESPDEDAVEAFATFEENALAKARFFAPSCDTPILADDSGICVDALDGAPGVRSKRFSGTDATGLERDLANNRHLLELLGDLPPDQRGAHYVCAVALLLPDGSEHLFRGTVHGVILTRPRGSGGFGYDPLFFVPELDATFAEVGPAVKNRVSHRARALNAALPTLQSLASGDTSAKPSRR